MKSTREAGRCRTRETVQPLPAPVRLLSKRATQRPEARTSRKDAPMRPLSRTLVAVGVAALTATAGRHPRRRAGHREAAPITLTPGRPAPRRRRVRPAPGGQDGRGRRSPGEGQGADAAAARQVRRGRTSWGRRTRRAVTAGSTASRRTARRTLLAKAHPFQTLLSGDGARIVTTKAGAHRPRPPSRSTTPRPAPRSPRASFAGLRSALDAETDRVLVGSVDKTLLWTTSTDSVAVVARHAGLRRRPVRGRASAPSPRTPTTAAARWSPGSPPASGSGSRAPRGDGLQRRCHPDRHRRDPLRRPRPGPGRRPAPSPASTSAATR